MQDYMRQCVPSRIDFRFPECPSLTESELRERSHSSQPRRENKANRPAESRERSHSTSKKARKQSQSCQNGGRGRGRTARRRQNKAIGRESERYATTGTGRGYGTNPTDQFLDQKLYGQESYIQNLARIYWRSAAHCGEAGGPRRACDSPQFPLEPSRAFSPDFSPQGPRSQKRRKPKIIRDLHLTVREPLSDRPPIGPILPVFSVISASLW